MEISGEERRSGMERRRRFKRRGPDRRVVDLGPTLDERTGKDRRQLADRRSVDERRRDHVTAMERHFRNRRARSERRKVQHLSLIFDEREGGDRRSAVREPNQAPWDRK